jgi:hypothetical protein
MPAEGSDVHLGGRSLAHAEPRWPGALSAKSPCRQNGSGGLRLDTALVNLNLARHQMAAAQGEDHFVARP